MVEVEEMTISKAAKKLCIKLPTAKVILSNYRKKGVILKKNCVKSQSLPTPVSQ
jgi:transposase